MTARAHINREMVCGCMRGRCKSVIPWQPSRPPTTSSSAPFLQNTNPTWLARPSARHTPASAAAIPQIRGKLRRLEHYGGSLRAA